MTALLNRQLTIPTSLLTALILSACSAPAPTPVDNSTSPPSQTSPLSSEILIDGSSTVFPISDEVAKEYQFERDNEPNISVAFSGTSSGFEKFCAGEIDISNASRPINREEMNACRDAGVKYYELPIAFDALTVVVHPNNTWAETMTVEELRTLWEPTAEGNVTTWNQIRSDWPNQPIVLFGPGEDSGTFDYFTEAVVGEARASRKDYTASEDDTELVRGVRNNPNSLGYFGYAYYKESEALLKAVAIEDGEGAILPSDETVRSGQYHPFARPLFIYVNVDKVEANPELQQFVTFYLKNARNLVSVTGYVALPDEAYNLALTHFQNGRIGTVFAGEAQINLTIEELLQKEAQL